MPSIVTRVEDSDLDVIGENIAALSDNPPNVAAGPHLEQREAVRLSYRTTGNPGADHMGNISGALSMSTITNTAGTWTDSAPIGPGPSSAIEAVADVKFIFERENEKVIVVPNKDALEFALQTPPFKEGDYIDAFAKETGAKIVEALDAEIDANHPNLASNKDEIMTALSAAIANRFPELSASQKEDVLYEQLGSYTCRQCG